MADDARRPEAVERSATRTRISHGLADEVREVQNPALAAVLLWRAVVAHEQRETAPVGFPIPALYLVLPMVLHGPTLALVIGTKPASGLRKFASKFAESKHAQTDLLLALHPRARAMRRLSTEALHIAVTAGLLRIVPGDALAFAVNRTLPPEFQKPVEQLVKGAERVGHWFRPLSLSEIGFTLNVRF